MTALQAAALYTALNLFLLVFLAYRVASRRQASKIGLGHGDNEELHRAVRVHGNAAEWLPGALLGLLLLALLDAPVLLIHALGVFLILGRGLHAYGLSASPGTTRGRVTGAAITLLIYVIEGAALFWFALR